MKGTKNFFNAINSLLITLWKGKVAAAVIVAVELVFTGASVKPLWMVLSALGGAYVFALTTEADRRYTEYKEKELQEALKNSSGKKWIMRTPSGVEIGQIEESDFLKSRYLVTSSWAFKRRQGLNLMWVALIHVLMYVVSLFGAALRIISTEDLTETTMEVMALMAEDVPGTIVSYCFFLIVYCILSIFVSKHYRSFWPGMYLASWIMRLTKSTFILSLWFLERLKLKFNHQWRNHSTRIAGGLVRENQYSRVWRVSAHQTRWPKTQLQRS